MKALRWILIALALIATPARAQTILTMPAIQVGVVRHPADGVVVVDALGGAFGTSSDPIFVSVVSGATAPTGTAGSPNAAVTTVQGCSGCYAVTVQGLASGVPLPVQTKGSATVATSQVTCSTSAAQIVAARSGRVRLIFTSVAATAFYYGAAGLTTATGMYVAAVAGASTTLDTAAAVYCITSSGTLTLTATELY